MLRITLAFIALLVTAVTAVGGDVIPQTIGSTQCGLVYTQNACIPLYVLTFLGGAGLVVAVLGHLVGTEARAIDTAGAVEDIDDLLSADGYSERRYLSERLQSYRDRIEYNHRVIAGLESVLATGKIGLALSIISLAAVVVSVSFGPIPAKGWLSALIVIGVYSVYISRRVPDDYIQRDSTLPPSRLTTWMLQTGDGTVDGKDGDRSEPHRGADEGDGGEMTEDGEVEAV